MYLVDDFRDDRVDVEGLLALARPSAEATDQFRDAKQVLIL